MRIPFVGLLVLIGVVSAAAQNIYWKKDHVYAGPGGPEIAIITPPTTDTTAPSAPTLDTPTVGYQSATLTWSASTDNSGGSGLAGYKIYRRIGTGANLPAGTVGSSDTRSFTDQPLKPNVTYTYTVVAFDKAQNHSSPSNSVNALTSTDTTAPSAPASMSIAYTSPTAVSMAWTASTDTGGSGLKGYRVYRDGTLISALVPGATRMLVDATLVANAPYTYTVTAVDNVGNESTGINRSVFRDDFNRGSGTGLNSPYWATSGLWGISSNQAAVPAGTSSATESFGTKSFASFNASLKTVDQGGSGQTSGIVFWSNDAGTERYVVNTSVGSGVALQYLTASQTNTLQTSGSAIAPYQLSVDADSASRVIKVSINGLQRFFFTETDTSRRNSGRIGMRANVASYPSNGIKTDEFVVVEKGGSLTSSDIVPTNVRLTYLSPTSVQVDWDASADIGNGVAGYEVFRGSTLVSGSSLLTSTTFQNTGLTANTAYSYTVKVVDTTPGTRFPSLTKAVFRDDFNRTGSVVSNSGWSSAGSWSLSSNTAQITDVTSWTNALTAASPTNLKVSASVSGSSSTPGAGYSGLVFWTNGTEGYRIAIDGLYYFTSSGEQLVASGTVTTGTLRVEANSSTRVINAYLNGTLFLSYVETNTSRRNTGQTGITGKVVYVEGCDASTCGALTATVDDFILEEQ